MIREETPAFSLDKVIATASNIERVRSTLRQMVRDWSDEGLEERTACYAPILAHLDQKYKIIPCSERFKIRILVPGAGLGRLAWEICRLGFSCTGNEFSFHMLLGSNYILNTCKTARSHDIYPYIHSFSNLMSIEDSLAKVSIPDIVPVLGDFGELVEFAMVAGNFTEIYSSHQEKHHWDAVITCFFIDTAHNVMDYISTIKNCLKPRGIWLNNGPLLWHFEGHKNELSLELNFEELKVAISESGFCAVTDEARYLSTYSTNPGLMMKNVYNSIFFTTTSLDQEEGE